ncbi:GNAT family N-acetyltransferase [Streptomyces sp. YIM B13508]|uniref:GNAT family N-acetyltransferase n=1 Tax=Streptomyces sp. YIM B13508 TaxID=3366315 RepID=UPI0036A7850A
MTLPTPELHTDRLRLRPFCDDDAAPLYALHSDPHVLRYWDSPPWTDPARAQRFLATCRRIEEEGTGARVAVERVSDGAFIGWCGLIDWNPDFRQRRTLLVSGVARTLWTILLPLTPSGAIGVFVIVAADFGLLFSAGIFNPSFTTYRMAATPDAFMSRVGTSWSVGAKTCQAAFVIAGGLIAAAAGVRGALLIAGLLCMASALLLPWREARFSTGPSSPSSRHCSCQPHR